MEYRQLGRSGLRVSEISLGSWLTLGSRVDQDATRRIVARAFELGVNLFDTADVYSEGESERALGEALNGIPRHQVVLASKAFFPMSEGANDRGLSRKHLFESVEGSLRRLGTGYLDLHQAHRADPATPLEETVRAYGDLIRQGKLLYWGVSHWDPAEIIEACRLADAAGAPRPISNQPPYSILRRGVETEVMPTCEREGLGQIVFSPLAQGVLSGKYAGGARPADSRAADPRRGVFMSDYFASDAPRRVQGLEPLAAELGLSMPQLALAWCLRTSGVASAIIGVTRVAQLEDDVRASGVCLPAEAAKRIDELFPPVSP